MMPTSARAGCTVFAVFFGEFVTFFGPTESSAPTAELQFFTYPVGADDSVRPQDALVFTELFGEFATAQRADVGIGPYKSFDDMSVRSVDPWTCFPP